MNNHIEEKLKELSKIFPLIDDIDFEYQAKIIKDFIKQALQEQEDRIKQEILKIVIEDVPHKYQKRLLKELNI